MQLHKRRGALDSSSSVLPIQSRLIKRSPTVILILALLIYGWWFVWNDNSDGASYSANPGNSGSSIPNSHTDNSLSTTATTGTTTPKQQQKQQQQQHKSYYPTYSSKPNAIIYMAQKSHKVYLRNSLALLERSLDLLFSNYLLLDNHYLNATVFIFHTGDFDEATDLKAWEARYPPKTRGTLQLINLIDTPYWQTPPWLNENDLPTWRNPEFNIGYRHMIRWYAIRMWDYFAEINRNVGTNYQYIMRMDEESFFHSPINYDLFHTMASNQYDYSFRICSYEMNAIQQIMHNYTTQGKNMWGDSWTKERHFNGASCGFYNNWFIGSLSFFRSDKVQHYLQWFDQEGFMYRDRLNDLVIQTGAVYQFLPSHRIHRFLDWTYEHFTLTRKGCPKWGALATGYNDDYANDTIQHFLQQLRHANCTIGDPMVMSRRQIPGLHVYHDAIADLSPTYSHLPDAFWETANTTSSNSSSSSTTTTTTTLVSVKAGRIDMPGRGERSG